MHKFIVLEGIDGAGTTTQCERLARAFGLHATREPSERPIGRLLRSLLTQAAHTVDERAMGLLFAADRLDHLHGEIVPALAQGSVISDRYLLSSLVYQSQQLDRAFVVEINRFARPADLTILLDVEVEVAETRRNRRGGAQERYDQRALQERLAAAYRAEAANLGALVVDGNGSPDAVFAALEPLVRRCLGRAEGV